MSYFKLDNPEKCEHIGSYFRQKRKIKYHNQGINSNFRFIRHLFNAKNDEENIRKESGACAIEFSLSREQEVIVCKNQRSELYIPIAIKRNKKVVSGIYGNLWNCGSNSHPISDVSLSDQPVESIVTAMCMFGYQLKGVDNHGIEHPLTNTSYTVPSGHVIEEIVLKEDAFHPYERMMYTIYENLMPFYKVLGGDKLPGWFHQIPFSEYIFYGLNLLIQEKMTYAAFEQYVAALRKRMFKHRRKTEDLAKKYGLVLDISGPMDDVLLDDGMNFSLENFLGRIGVDPERVCSPGSFIGAPNNIRMIFDKTLDWLAKYSEHKYLAAWQNIRNKNKHGIIKENALHPIDHSLLAINYFSYIVKIAAAKELTPNGKVCLSHPYCEKQMALAYKETFSGHFGNILAFYWLLPLFSNISDNDSIYYLDKHIPLINEMINKGLIELCLAETAAQVSAKTKNDEFHQRKHDVIHQVVHGG